MFFLVFILSFLVRLISLNQSLWLDEGTTARVVRQYNFAQIAQIFSPHDFHPPLFYLFMKVWTSIFGYSEVALRMPSVIFSLLTGWFVYLIGKQLKDKRTGIWAAVLFLFNPLVVYYSQEARMYMMVTMLLTAALYYFIRLLKNKPKIEDYFLFNIFTFFSFLTFYGSVFLIIGFYIYLLFKRQTGLLLKLLPGFLLSCTIVSPLLYQQFRNSRTALALVPNWKNVLGTANLKNLLLIPLKFSIGRISWEPKAVYYATDFLWTGVVFWFAYRGIIKKTVFLYLFIIPLTLGFLFSFFAPLLQYFRFLYLIPSMCLLLALGATKKWQRLILFFGFLLLSSVYLFFPRFHREDWKSLAKTLPHNSSVYMILPSSDPLRYYGNNIRLSELRTIYNATEEAFIVIPYTADIYGFDYKEKLKDIRYELENEQNFKGDLQVQYWHKK